MSLRCTVCCKDLTGAVGILGNDVEEVKSMHTRAHQTDMLNKARDDIEHARLLASEKLAKCEAGSADEQSTARIASMCQQALDAINSAHDIRWVTFTEE